MGFTYLFSFSASHLGTPLSLFSLFLFFLTRSPRVTPAEVTPAVAEIRQNECIGRSHQRQQSPDSKGDKTQRQRVEMSASSSSFGLKIEKEEK